MITIKADSPDYFDDLVHNSLPDNGHLIIASKKKATAEGRTAVVLSFMVEAGGKAERVQTVVSLREFLLAIKGLQITHEKELLL